MLLTISTTYSPATDLGFLLEKHPARVHEFELASGKATVFYPETSDRRCTVALLLDVDPIGLVRGKGGARLDGPLEQYVNDRPYVASSFLSVALGVAFRSALAGKCRYRPELATTAIPLEASIPAVPAELVTRASVPGIPGARYWVGLDIEPLIRDVLAARKREQEFLAQSGKTGELPPAEMLAVSGGGDKGAFGAGVLNGWTATGNRPTFKSVTGISTGALIAPFAFLGPEYDHVLKEVYTSVAPTDIASRRNVLAAIREDGMADNRPLWNLISKYVDQPFLDRVAAEHAKGRILLIGTTDLDARQPVIWNMGIIAASGAPGALDLFRSILLASAAIPGAFPPTMIRVEVDGKTYEEMHVDGGAPTQVFLYPPSLRAVAQAMGETMTREGHVYVLRNSSLGSTWNPVERRTISIAGQAIGSMIHTQGIGDVFRIYLTTQRDGLDFNPAYIGSEFVYEGKKEQFETAYMIKLYDYGYRLAEKGYPWKKLPPGLESPLGR